MSSTTNPTCPFGSAMDASAFMLLFALSTSVGVAISICIYNLHDATSLTALGSRIAHATFATTAWFTRTWSKIRIAQPEQLPPSPLRVTSIVLRRIITALLMGIAITIPVVLGVFSTAKEFDTILRVGLPAVLSMLWPVPWKSDMMTEEMKKLRKEIEELKLQISEIKGKEVEEGYEMIRSGTDKVPKRI